MKIASLLLILGWGIPPKITETYEPSAQNLPNTQVEKFHNEQPVKLHRSDDFEEYKALAPKVLYTHDEQMRVRALLSSPELIRQAYLDLLDSKSQEEIRFERLDYFEKAIAWAENPAREKIIDSLKQIFLSESLFEIDNVEHRKSIVGDKIEIFGILKQFAPVALEEITKLSKDLRINKVIAYSENIHNSH